ncbi:MAG: DUF2207 domain-containing protein [Actinomycetes bacterium]
MPGAVRRVALAGLLVAVWLLPWLSVHPAVAAAGDRIASYDVVLTVRDTGALDVTETIAYDFGSSQRHGIFRDVPTRVPYDATRDRVYQLHDVRVQSPTGAPADVTRNESAGVTQLRIGNPDQTVSGRQTYVIRYTIDGALNAFADHVELFWNAIGAEWDAPIAAASARVMTPGPVQKQTCFAGPTGSSLPCGSSRPGPTPNEADFAQPGGLGTYSAMTVVVSLQPQDVRATGPILEERPPPPPSTGTLVRRALTPTPTTGGLAVALLLLGGGGLAWLLGTTGRDRRFVGQTPGVLPAAGQAVREAPVPLLNREPVAVAFAPPEGLRPGQLGTLLDEQANVLDVTATIVDLAVRGYLRIEEIERAHWFSSRDWRLVKLAGGRDPLRPYERELYDGLFESGDSVQLSDLKKHFAARLAKVQDKLYDDVTAAGWFRGRPDKVRSRWSAAGFVLAFVGGWLTWLLVRHGHWAVVGAAITLLGILLHIAARRMPARTARGSAVLAQAKGFREYIRTAEAEQLRFEEREDIFSRYLPYAIIFGEADRWVRVFGALAVGAAGTVTAGPGWYVGSAGWDPNGFSESINGFASATSGTIAAATPSSSGGSGFSGGSSGGGGGGGGGGSW